MKKFLLIILIICLCFLVGCEQKKETGFEEHYEERPLIYMGIKCDSKKVKEDELKINLSFGWEQLPDMERENKQSLDAEFVGVVIATSANNTVSIDEYGFVEMGKDGELIFHDMQNVIFIDKKECKEDKYFVEMTGFRKPNYNNTIEYKIDKSILLNEKKGDFYINICQLLYLPEDNVYYFGYVKAEKIYYEINEEGLVDLFVDYIWLK